METLHDKKFNTLERIEMKNVVGGMEDKTRQHCAELTNDTAGGDTYHVIYGDGQEGIITEWSTRGNTVGNVPVSVGSLYQF